MTAIRCFFVLTALGISGWTGYIAYDSYKNYIFLTGDQAHLHSIPFNDVTKAAFDARMEESRSQVTYCILLFGVLWGTILLDKDAPLRLGAPEWIMFFLAHGPLAVHTLLYVGFSRIMSGLAIAGGRASVKD